MIFSKLSYNIYFTLALTTVTHQQLTTFNADATDVHDRDLATSAATKSYLMTFADYTISPAERCAALAQSTGGSVLYVYDFVLNGCALTLPVSQQPQAQAAFTALSNSPGVMNVEFDQMVYTSQPQSTSIPESNDNIFATSSDIAKSWGLDRIDQCSLPLNGQMTKQDATGVTMFIVDTGVRSDHVEFANGVISTENCHFSAISGETALSDGDGHGYDF